jgi:hypothetical protein
MYITAVCRIVINCYLLTYSTSLIYLVNVLIYCDRKLDNQFAVNQQVKVEQALFRDPFLSPLRGKRAVLSLNRAALSPAQDTNAPGYCSRSTTNDHHTRVAYVQACD